MNDDQFEDLKRFIDSRISQSESRFDEKLSQSESRLEDKLYQSESRFAENLQKVSQNLSAKLEDLDLKIDTISEAQNENVGEFDVRLTKLEQQTA